jgi:hypothetical protein
VNPDDAGHALGCDRQLRPIFTAFIVSFVCRCTAEREGQTNKKPSSGKKDIIELD